MVVELVLHKVPAKWHASVSVGKYACFVDSPLMACVTGFPISFIVDVILAVIPAIFMPVL